MSSFNINSSFYHLLIVSCLCILITISAVDGKMSKKKLKFCKPEMLLECGIEPNAMFTSTQNGSGIVNSDDEMEQFCL